jgi:phage baseplate assembly protein W
MSNATVYDFGSVGDTLPTLREHEKASFQKSTIKFNPRTPLKLSTNKDELFIMNETLADATADNLRNLILTNRGERVMQPNFGANLKAILTEFGTEGFEAEVMKRIKTAAAQYLPYVALSTMSLQKLDSTPQSGLIVVKLNIGYSIPRVNIVNQQLTVTLSTVS